SCFETATQRSRVCPAARASDPDLQALSLRRRSGIALGHAGLDPDVAAVAPTQLLQGLPERREVAGRVLLVRDEMSTPMRRIRSPCCARAASGHAAAPPRSVINARLFMAMPRLAAAPSTPSRQEVPAPVCANQYPAGKRARP